MGLTVGLILIGAVGLPVAGVVLLLLRHRSDVASTPPPETPVFVWGSIGYTFLYTGLIGILATVLGLPAAWSMRQARPWKVALIGVPLLMPSYLAYAGWGMLRGPGSWLGDWLGHGPTWLAAGFDRWLAVAGLSLWAWPIAALVIGASARRIPAHLLDALDLEPAAMWRKGRVVLGMLAAPIGASVVLIALVMAGSAIPLHLAQVETYAIHLWKYMSVATDAASIWPAAAPLLIVAGIAAAILTRGAGRPRLEVRDQGDAQTRRGSRSVNGLAIAVWGLSVVAPVVLFLVNLRRWSSITDFWKLQDRAVWSSLEIGGIVGGFVGLLAIGVFALRSCRPGSGLARASLWAMLTTALVPGVLIGSATLAFWNAPFLPRAAGNSLWPVVFAHTARFGFLGALAGWWLAGLETADERGARLMLAGNGLRAWAALCLRPNIGAVIGIALAAAALSLHEIESTIQVQPPGPQSLAQYLLDKLHYNRNEELCAACINVLVIGTLLAGGSGWLLGRVAERANRSA